MAAKQNQDIENLLAPLGWDVQWIEFQFGPQMLEPCESAASTSAQRTPPGGVRCGT